MLTIRPASERGRSQIDWLDSRHTFSFGDYYDPRHMGFRALRVINDDRVRGASGFGTHPHRDMEIVTYVLEGALEHKDSLGTGSVIRPGDVQRMSAGTGVRHSEWNHSKSEPVHFLQIWIEPDRRGLPPGYEQKTMPDADGLRLLASRDGRDGSVTVHQDVALFRARLAAGQKVRVPLAAGRHAWVHVARGALLANGKPLATGDGASASGESKLDLEGQEATEALVFDLA